MLIRKSMVTTLLACFMAVGATLGTVLLAAAQEPHEIVQETSDRVLEIIKQRGEKLENDPEARSQLVDEILGPVVDFEVFSQLVLGVNWRTASPEQRTRFMRAFEDMLARTYTKSLSDYAGTEVEVLPPRGEQREDYRTVYTEIRSQGSQAPLSVAYSFRFDNDRWRAYDLTIDGLSLVKNFRSSFDNEIERNGLDGLIARLERGGEGLAPDTATQ